MSLRLNPRRSLTCLPIKCSLLNLGLFLSVPVAWKRFIAVDDCGVINDHDDNPKRQPWQTPGRVWPGQTLAAGQSPKLLCNLEKSTMTISTVCFY